MMLAALSLGVAAEEQEEQESQSTILNDILQRRFLHFGRDGHGTGRRIKCSVHKLVYIFRAYFREVLSSLNKKFNTASTTGMWNRLNTFI